jgi:MFS family permease
VLAFAEGMLVPVLPLYVASLGVPFWWVGLVLAAEAIGMLIADLPAGALLRRIDRKTAMLLGIALLGLAALALAWADGGGVRAAAAGGPRRGPVGHLAPRLPDRRRAAAAARPHDRRLRRRAAHRPAGRPGGRRGDRRDGRLRRAFVAYAAVAAVPWRSAPLPRAAPPAPRARRGHAAHAGAPGGRGPAVWRGWRRLARRRPAA